MDLIYKQASGKYENSIAQGISEKERVKRRESDANPQVGKVHKSFSGCSQAVGSPRAIPFTSSESESGPSLAYPPRQPALSSMPNLLPWLAEEIALVRNGSMDPER